MADALNGKSIAILATEGFEPSELNYPLKTLREHGATVEILAPGGHQQLRGWDKTAWTDGVAVDRPVEDAFVRDYDALVLPGGVVNTDALREYDSAVQFVKDFLESQKPVAAICHAGSVLIETGLLQGRRMTSYYSIKTDLEHAGVRWLDHPAIVDGNLITSRHPGDLQIFTERLMNALEEKVGAE
jgi:protease I